MSSSQSPQKDSKVALAQEILEIENQIFQKEAEIKNLNIKLKIKEARLLELMVEQGFKEFTTEGGKKVVIQQSIYTSFLVAQKADVFSWLREQDREDLIKTDVNKRSLRSLVTKILDEDPTQIPECIKVTYAYKIGIKDSRNRSLRKAPKRTEEE